MVQASPTMRRGVYLLALVLCLLNFSWAQSEPEAFDEWNVPIVTDLLDRGEYEEVVRLCGIALRQGHERSVWIVMRQEALSRLGRTDEALAEAERYAKKEGADIPLLMAWYDAAVATGKKELAAQVLQKINQVARSKPAKERSGHDLIALGKAALAAGADAQKVTQQFYTPAKKMDGQQAAASQAIGNLALEKEDFTRAAEEFREGLKARPGSSDLRYGLASAFKSGDRKKCLEELAKVLEINPHHTEALALRAELWIAAEKFSEAASVLDQALAVNPHHAESWALQAVIAILWKNDPAAAEQARQKGLKTWPQNPAVDYTLGRCLSRAYRFKEGADHQQEALRLDEKYLPAKVQLCLDYLRLGEVEEAWKLAAAIRQADAYQAQAHNFGLLETEMKDFATVQDEYFTLRMPQRDREIYGARALELLREARVKLAEKYGAVFARPVVVEFFPSQQDFAIRTFGNLGGQGVLGACFGTVVTMNSPGSISARRSNWESTLWHEYCHVVTLTATRNRMPRWLSEGISVYEEGVRDPACAMRLTLSYRKMILEEKALTPIRELSAAFMNPKSGEHLMFAYFQAGQVTEFLIEKYGLEKFRALLAELAHGTRINEALAKHTASLEQLEKQFAARMMKAIEDLAPQADLTEPKPEELNRRDAAAVVAYTQTHPKNYPALQWHTQALLRAERWSEAQLQARRLIELCPEDVEPGCGYDLAAAAARGLGNTQMEAGYLQAWARRSGDTVSAYLRLLELNTAALQWKDVSQAARWALAVNPFLKKPYEALAQAAEEEQRADDALWALRHLQLLGPDNPADANFRLARLLRDKDVPAARRYVLDALAEAPRHRQALELLEQLHGKP